MTKEERWRAAIEEAKPLMDEARKIREKYDLRVFKLFTSNYIGQKPWCDISALDDPEDENREGLYCLSYCGDDGKPMHFTTINWSDFDDVPDDMEEEVE